MRLAGLLTISFVVLVASVSADDKPATGAASAQQEEPRMKAETFTGLALRSIGPALMAGRVGDFAVDPRNKQHYYVAVCSGNVWKTTNGGITFTPVFDGQGSYSIGCVTMDPHDSNVVWVGTGENNSQRSVAFGDGVYLTRDGGKNWKNMGLGDSEHIGMIAIDPRDSNVVYVAAQGPLWRDGPQRGLYKTTNAGETWNNVLNISGQTGVNEVHLDPRDPDIVYATTYQRRRHVWTLIDGGPESAIYKSTDAGKTWRKLTNGVPEGDKGRIGLAVSPANPDVIYAIIEATEKNGGIFRSTDRGETWEKRNDYVADSPQYYNELIPDPVNVDRFYTLDTLMHVSEDGGKTLSIMPRKNRHVDDHALWIDPDNTDHLLVGCDGGMYETYDRGDNWGYKVNLPVTQFYRISTDNSLPFYYVYGGTQDNNSVGAPSRTTDQVGIANEDWFVTTGGDGYETCVDPEDPNVVYSQWQYGGLVRYNRQTGETVDIKPRELPGEDAYRWNWDSPLIISPHSHTRLYFACQKLFRTDDGGNSWRAISDDLSRQLDRDQLKVMGKIQLADAVAKHWNTSWYGNCVSLSESPLVEGLIYIGTDDGLIQVTEDGGKNWRKIDQVLGVPELSYVSCLTASRHDADTVYATFDNHKAGDFKPYLYVSGDRGRTWKPISGDLPDRDIAYSLQEDHVKPELLFVGTEFGAYFTVDRGEKWIKLTGGMPTISVRDIDIQRRENDVVLGTFGRGIYILDDYAPLREVSEELLAQDALMFAIKDALWYVPSNRLGDRDGRGSQGASYFATPNPPFGAVFTYYLKDKIKTRKEVRHEAEQEAEKAGKTPPYPTMDALRAEDEEREPRILFTVCDKHGEVVQRVVGSREKGFHRVAWNLRYPAFTPTSLTTPGDKDPWWEPPAGPLALPGTYTVTMAK
ncbi:MAG: glycosyl hydrolase, partial [Phycisphaerae bacterium]|nr:glycosyl hydrolase [Phycisphaerae bacterium]